MTYDLPLRPGFIVRVTLPLDLTQEDAARFAGYIKLLPFSPSQSAESTKTPQEARDDGRDRKRRPPAMK
jgi:hypothetical protein